MDDACAELRAIVCARPRTGHCDVLVSAYESAPPWDGRVPSAAGSEGTPSPPSMWGLVVGEKGEKGGGEKSDGFGGKTPTEDIVALFDAALPASSRAVSAAPEELPVDADLRADAQVLRARVADISVVQDARRADKAADILGHGAAPGVSPAALLSCGDRSLRAVGPRESAFLSDRRTLFRVRTHETAGLGRMRALVLRLVNSAAARRAGGRLCARQRMRLQSACAPHLVLSAELYTVPDVVGLGATRAAVEAALAIAAEGCGCAQCSPRPGAELS